MAGCLSLATADIPLNRCLPKGRPISPEMDIPKPHDGDEASVIQSSEDVSWPMIYHRGDCLVLREVLI